MGVEDLVVYNIDDQSFTLNGEETPFIKQIHTIFEKVQFINPESRKNHFFTSVVNISRVESPHTKYYLTN